LDVVVAFIWGDVVEGAGDSVVYGLDASFGGTSHAVLELGEQLLDWIEIWTVGRQEEEPRSSRPDDVADGLALVRAEIVENDNVPGLQCFDEFGFDIDAEGLRIDGAVNDPRRLYPIMPQRGDEGHRLPMTVWRVSHQPLAAHTPAAQWRHVGLDPCFIQEDQARGVNAGLVAHPLRAPAHQLWLELLGRQNGFF